ncbi:MAG: DUF4003 domain-containing protein [Oscillospiraceae bacterium]|nr:DUF4003 domain-containing protein [Oscillospiraceae bacterium]
MTEQLQQTCELFERNRTAISKKFLFEKTVMRIAAALIFTGAGREADAEKLAECRSILNQHTDLFSVCRDSVKLALLSEMALSDDAEQYIEDVKLMYQKLHKGHFLSDLYMVLAAMLITDLGRQSDTDAVIERHNELMQQMEKQHPFLTDPEDISYVILLALSDRPVGQILGDMEECMDYLKKTRKVKVGSDSVQRLSEILALTGEDVREQCDQVIRLYDLLQQDKSAVEDGYVFSSLGMLIGMDAGPEQIVNEILAANAFLKANRIFDEKQEGLRQRLMLAELLVAESYGTGNSMIRNAFINNALSVIKAQQVATVITVISNVLPAVLGAVTEKDSSGSGSDAEQAAESEQEKG